MRNFLDKHLKRSISVKRLADVAGIYPSTIYRWLDNKHHPSIYNLKLMCTAIARLTKKDKDELYLECCNNISVFELDTDLFNRSIEYLISRDYVRNENGIYQALFY